MLAIKGWSGWDYVTSQSVSISGGTGLAGGIEAGSSITLKHKDKGTYKFWYASLGIGVGAGVKIPFKFPNPSPSFAFESFPSNGVLCILEAFRGEELQASDITGYTLFISVSGTLAVGGQSVYAMLLGIENIEKLLKEAYSDIFQIGQTLGGGSQIILNLQDRMGLFKNSAKAVLFMGGFSAGLGLGVTALGSIGYVWQGTTDKIGEIILDFKSIEEIPTPPIHQTQKDKSVVLISTNVLFECGEYVLKPKAITELEKLLPKIKSYSNRNINILGYADNTENHKKSLSANRAKAVWGYLVGRGIYGSKMKTDGRGADDPVATNSTKEGRDKNRRVEIYIMPN